MKPTLQELTPVFEAIIKEASEAVKNFSNAFTGEYDKVQNSFESYCRVNGIITPADMQDFFHFLCLKFPDEPTGAMVNEAKKPHNYKLFHGYKQRLFNNPDWTDMQELQHWQSPQHTKEQIDTSSLPAKYKVLTYLIECDAKGQPRYPNNSKKDLIEYSKRRWEYTTDTFYRQFSCMYGMREYELYNEDYLNAEFKTDWKKYVLSLSDSPDVLKNYLKTKNL